MIADYSDSDHTAVGYRSIVCCSTERIVTRNCLDETVCWRRNLAHHFSPIAVTLKLEHASRIQPASTSL